MCPVCPHAGSVLARELGPGRGGLVKAAASGPQGDDRPSRSLDNGLDNHRSLAAYRRHGLVEELSSPHPSYRRLMSEHRPRTLDRERS